MNTHAHSQEKARIALVIAECNPFHQGHAYILDQARKIAGPGGYVIVCASGNYVQRGEPAILPWTKRVPDMLRGGADLVVSLPYYFSCSAADYFARGSILTLRNLGCVTDLVFGAEHPDPEGLRQAADFLNHEPADFKELLQTYLGQGLSYPLARSRAAAECSAHVVLPDTPNDSLGLEYVRALQKYDLGHIAIHQAKRIAASSASQLRNEFLSRQRSLASQNAASDPAESYYMSPDDFTQVLLANILNHMDQLDDYLGVSQDLANRIKENLPQLRSVSTFTDLMHTRNTTRSGSSRALLHILLGLTDARMDQAIQTMEDGGYLRILGCRKDKKDLLGLISRSCQVPLVMNPGRDRQLLSGMPRTMLEDEIRVNRLYEQTLALHETGSEYIPEYERPFLFV